MPPSSSDIFFTVSALWRIRIRPTSVDPVNVILRTTGFAHSSWPIATASPVTMLRTPLGMPARSASSANASAENGVCSAGFSTMVQPAASPGDTLRVIIALGKFHGVIAPTTPIGCLMTTSRRSLVGDGITSP